MKLKKEDLNLSPTRMLVSFLRQVCNQASYAVESHVEKQITFHVISNQLSFQIKNNFYQLYEAQER